jgi:hypothetical protein
VVTGETVLGLVQTALAGQFLSGHFGGLEAHATNAALMAAGAGLTTIAAILLWRPGRGPWWPAAVCLLLVVSTGAQIRLGYGRVLAVHIPLGVSIICALAVMLAWAWRPPRAAQPAALSADGLEPQGERIRIVR